MLNRLRAFVLRKEMRVEEDAGLLVPNLEGDFFNFFHTFPCNTLFVRQTGFCRHFGQRTITQSAPQGKQTLVSHHS